MIQRKQTLFLFQLVFLGIAMLFISSNTVISATSTTEVYLTPLHNPELTSTTAHLAAISINFAALILAFITIFLYKSREVQIRLCYALMALWLVLSLLIAFCPFVVKTGAVSEIQTHYFGCIIGFFAILAAGFAARFIKKDIELLKSADRIR